MRLLKQQMDKLTDQQVPWVLTDAVGRIKSVNTPFVDMCGYQLEEIIGMKPKEFLHGPMTEQDRRDELSSYLWNRLPVSTSITNYRKNQESYRVHLTIFPIKVEPEYEPLFFAVEFELEENQSRLPSAKRELLFSVTRELSDKISQ